ncbi:hypothetical protein LPJ61_004034 [Coemansia biformis]|uniref:Uncharacterized protein n=1 Tax=Coemansia biformis TaxID=1286918 RepID=A0A9W7YAA3_9FUNG|nr:hypothetical protein LPJ61_004034 [Coemansia biformis]
MSMDSPLPSLPPLPAADPGALAAPGPATAPPPPPPPTAMHRRTASAGDELRHVPSAPESSSDQTSRAAATARHQPKPRRGLSSLRVVWPSSKARRSRSIDTSAGRARWTAEEATAVAQASLRAWKSGCPVDRDSLAADGGRSVAAVSEMLEYMLEGYVRFGSAACWDGQCPKFIMRWAAVEFPSNPALNPISDRPRPASSAMARLDACLSALTCRPRSASRDVTYALDSPEDGAAGQLDVMDFREEMRLPTVAHDAGSGVQSRRSRDSGTVESPVVDAPRTPGPENIEMSADQSLQTIEVTRPDAELDAQFADLGAEARLKMRRFVSQFIRAHPSDFQKRVDAHRRGQDALCLSVDHYPDFERHSGAFIKAVETLYREIGGTLTYTRNLYFHAQLVHAIRIDRIPVTDDSWLGANEFATAVFNQRIENAQFVMLHEYTADGGGGDVVASASGSGDWMLGARTKAEIRSGSDGNEHQSPFFLARYMDRNAESYVSFLYEVMDDRIMQRVHSEGPRPMPVALQVDAGTMLPIDVEVRDKVIAFIWEDIPRSRRVSKEIVLLRALERMNARIIALCGYHEANVHQLMSNRNDDGRAETDRAFASPEAVRGIPSSELAHVVGRAFARAHFHSAKSAFLLAMMRDHPFRPVSRDEVKEWIAQDSGPFGEDVDFVLNVGLYRYLRQLNLRPSSKQWLQTSAAATLSMLRRTLNAADGKHHLAHIGIVRYESGFADIIRDARSGADGDMPGAGAAQGSVLVVGQGAGGEPAFERMPWWVRDMQESRLSSMVSSRGGQPNGVASRGASTPSVRPQGDEDRRPPQERGQLNGHGHSQSSSQSGSRASSRGGDHGAAAQRPGMASGPSMADAGFPMPMYEAVEPQYAEAGPQYVDAGPLSPHLHPHAVPMPSCSHYTSDHQEYHAPMLRGGHAYMAGPAETAAAPQGVVIGGVDLAAMVRKMEEMEETIKELRALNGRV